MRRVLFIEDSAPPGSIMGGRNALSGSIAISGIRCLITYIFIPLLGPVVGLGGFGPVLGLSLGALSVVFIVMSMRRFFAADHKWRWGYASIGIVLMLVVLVQSVFDIKTVLGG
jgi:hypothetical protein